MIVKNFILEVGVSNATNKEILEFILKGLKNENNKLYIVTPNPEIIVRAHHDITFRKILNDASLALADGTGVIWAGRILGKKFKEKITGVDTIENLCKLANDYAFTVGFLGGGPKVADRAAECLKKKYPGLKVKFAGSELKSAKLLKSPIDILFVAFGAPKQEFWISGNIRKVPVKVVLGVGGAFDYISGRVPRAPVWLRNLGFEWLFRLINEPWRIKRQLALIEFVYLVLLDFIAKRVLNISRA